MCKAAITRSPAGPRNDMESLGYLLLYAAGATLPWASAYESGNVAAGNALKLAATPLSLTTSLPPGAVREALRSYFESICE